MGGGGGGDNVCLLHIDQSCVGGLHFSLHPLCKQRRCYCVDLVKWRTVGVGEVKLPVQGHTALHTAEQG